MKARDSGMPDEATWSTFFAAETAINRLFGGGRVDGDVVEFGCGYGTFTLPVARRTIGVVTALDIEPEMVALVRQKAADQKSPERAGGAARFRGRRNGPPRRLTVARDDLQSPAFGASRPTVAGGAPSFEGRRSALRHSLAQRHPHSSRAGHRYPPHA